MTATKLSTRVLLMRAPSQALSAACIRPLANGNLFSGLGRFHMDQICLFGMPNMTGNRLSLDGLNSEAGSLPL